MSVIDGTSAASSAIRGWYSRPARGVRPAADPAQLVALRQGVYRVPDHVRSVRVLAGYAWISLDGADHILRPGERLAIQPGGDIAVVSALGAETLVLEAETGRTF